ncbi:MAG: hypothetical protein PGN22_03115 [Agrobacterium cavarae]
MMDAFHTPEADKLAERLAEINARHATSMRKMRLAENITLVLVSTLLMFGGCLALEHTLSIQAKDRQESVAWVK